MTRVISIIILLVILIFRPFAPALAQTEDFNFQHLTPKQGLPNLVFSVLKDSKGFMWFATNNGLYRFDGQNFKSYRYHPGDTSSISGNLVSSDLFEDRDGYIWAGATANGLNKFDRNTETFQRFKSNPDDPGSLSNNNVKKLYQDADGTIWIATEYGLNKYHPEREEFSIYKPDPNHLKSGANQIKAMFEDSEGTFWVGTSKGVYQFIKGENTFQKSNELSKIPEGYKRIEFRHILEDNEGVLWFATNCGLIRYNRKTEQIKRYKHLESNTESIIDNDIQCIAINPENGANRFWLATTGGLVSFNRRTERFISFLHDPKNSYSLGSNILWDLYLDKTGTLWISTENAGVDFVLLKKSHFAYFDLPHPDNKNEKYSAASFCKDSKGNMWVGSFLGGLFQFDSLMNLIGYQDFGGSLRKKISLNYIRCIYEDSNGTLWLGNSGGGVYKYDTIRKKFIQIPFKDNTSIIVYRIFEDSFGVLWISSNVGILIRDQASGRIVHYYDRQMPSLQFCSNCKFYEDSYNCLWISTHGNGVFMLSPENRSNMQFVNFRHNAKDPYSISSNIVNTVRQDADNNLWLATSRGLNKFKRKQNRFESVDSETGLGAAYVYHAEADNRGYLFLTTEKGLMMFDPESEQKEKSKFFGIQDGLPFDDIFPYFFYKSQDGSIYVGGGKDSEKGFFVFNPDSLHRNEHVPPIVITDFKIRNKAVKMDSSIVVKKQIRLKHNQNYFSFDFASLDYINSAKNNFAYILEGYDNDWNYLTNRRFANYTGVPPGNYTFKVRGSNNDGIWNEQGAGIDLHIAKPPWNSWWSNVIYVLFILGLIYSWRRYDLKRLQLKRELEVEHTETERLAELDKLKTRFFANISHEFRTPLTLIIGPVEKLISKINDKACVEDLGMIQRNALRLQKLINQLLSLTKLESGKMKLRTREEDLVLLIKGYVQSFAILADKKNIKLSYKSRHAKFKMEVDRDKFDKIMYNLLSNAFKFTAEGGKIRIELQAFTYRKNKSEGVRIRISDNGMGIAPERIPYIFDRFYQVEDSSVKFQEGSGIGLSLTKELVKLHRGKIWVDSVEGSGTTFSVFLPFVAHNKLTGEVEDGTAEETGVPDEDDLNFYRENKETLAEIVEEVIPKPFFNNIPIVLIVEDNADMRTFISSYLNDTYNVIEAVNGEEGFLKATTEIPDLVISDVMMPIMDGNQLCSKLKTDERSSHIPIIMLTAKIGDESKMEGLEAGADAYLTKPFSGKELMLRVKNLIGQRRQLREFFSKQIASPQQSPLTNLKDSGITSMDQKFVERAISIVEENMDNTDFSVEMFGREMALSRVQLHRKLKAIVNQSASTFIRTIRLNRAALLLSKQAGNVTEIAYDVGFNNLSYFAKCFNEQFGQTPSDFAEKNRQSI